MGNFSAVDAYHFTKKLHVNNRNSIFFNSLSIFFTYTEIRKRGGECVVAHCDHSEPKQVEELFRKIASENASTLDILVNSAFAGNPVKLVKKKENIIFLASQNFLCNFICISDSF